MFGQQPVERFLPRDPYRVFARILVSLAVGGRLGLLEQVLVEPAHFGVGVGRVEGDQVGEAARGLLSLDRGYRPEISAHLLAQFEHQHGEAVFVHLPVRFEFDFDHHCACALKIGDCRIEHRLQIRAIADLAAHDPDPYALKREIREARCVIHYPGHAHCCAVGRVFCGDRAQQQRRVMDRPRHRPGGILRARNRHHMRAADQPDARLEPDNTVDRGRAGDRTVGLRANRGPGKTCRDCGPAARRRAAAVAIGRVRIAGQPADRAPAAGRTVGADVSPFGKVGLAQHQATRPAQVRDQRRIAAGEVCRERQAACGCGEFLGLDIVLHQHAAAIERSDIGERAGLEPCRLRIDDDRIEPFGAGIVLLDPFDLFGGIGDRIESVLVLIVGMGDGASRQQRGEAGGRCKD